MLYGCYETTSIRTCRILVKKEDCPTNASCSELWRRGDFNSYVQQLPLAAVCPQLAAQRSFRFRNTLAFLRPARAPGGPLIIVRISYSTYYVNFRFYKKKGRAPWNTFSELEQFKDFILVEGEGILLGVSPCLATPYMSMSPKAGTLAIYGDP